jgi:hypothetical protein
VAGLKMRGNRRGKIDCAAPFLIAAHAPGIGSTGITSMASPGKIVKCG